ncbi:uncharacterized protein cd8b [Triplophysa dalaica]|uniref:uncharacterized protein cd8b n=1 Tax=Triplophysa dalaica TaxID=1582913 RepID=UPI0024E0175B|nr:uncharacterized protein cd8b [Triplophysa dalaica]XP_056587446.1 uncharacterized protein cd8b [Triplophysa dalaica]XP_056587447.1 uncharacterized protein cd8b [Triplophysa dalaica]XP_056587448.1 uncharacterized protein cd8b [Triplophysa dalaica]XP_056587449.1 uncharacterized protein cd8b [Triplophysa dalaica]XP_056587450.1 uncharacterized protein cd8b [Triplophysa dalaica]
MTVPRVWICLFVWTAAATLTTSRAMSTILYTKVNGSETLTCECPDHTCQEVFWYRYLEKNNSFEFLLYFNSAGSEKYENIANKHRFRGSVSSGHMIYTLRITGLQMDEAGLYSCMFKIKNTIPDGYYIRPGVNPPTLHPPTVKPEKPNRSCRPCKPFPPKGCKSSVLWPGIGALLLLAGILAGTLFYFSRLPKKCRHQFAKTNQLR